MHATDIPGSRLARLAVAGLFAHAACAVARIAVSLLHVPLLRRYDAGHDVPDAYFAAVNDALTLIALAEIPAWLFTIAVFPLWLHRARLNLRAAGIGGLEYGPAWAIFSWFVPILNLFGPYHVTREVWEASGPISQSRRLIGPVEAWWGAWVLMWVLLYPVRKGVAEDATIPEWLAFTWWSIGAAIATAACAWLVVRVVRQTMARQRALLARRREEAPGDAGLALAGGEVPRPSF